MIVRDGIYYGLGFGASAVAVSTVFHPLWSAPFWVLGAFCVYFFRDPERRIPAGDVAVSPADGKVIEVVPLKGGQTRVTVFLNIFNVHVNRSPIAGEVSSVEYQKGKFLMAFDPKASELNEQNTLTIDGNGSRITVKQIAGLVARRIVCNKKPGDRVEKGERFGLIKFGSRADIHLGPEWEIAVREGDKVAGGSSILAKRRSAA